MVFGLWVGNVYVLAKVIYAFRVTSKQTHLGFAFEKVFIFNCAFVKFLKKISST